MDKKAQKRIEVLRKKIAELQPRLAGAKKQMDDPDEVRRLEAELSSAQAEIEKLKSS
jgi:peptidoglycan hydrolase CwlO-like protein